MVGGGAGCRLRPLHLSSLSPSLHRPNASREHRVPAQDGCRPFATVFLDNAMHKLLISYEGQTKKKHISQPRATSTQISGATKQASRGKVLKNVVEATDRCNPPEILRLPVPCLHTQVLIPRSQPNSFWQKKLDDLEACAGIDELRREGYFPYAAGHLAGAVQYVPRMVKTFSGDAQPCYILIA